MSREGTVYKAYLDPISKPTICSGHTKGVHLGQVASKQQCEQFYLEDMTDAMNEVIKISPNLSPDHHPDLSALQASGDFVLNAGPQWFARSPMKIYFDAGEWVKGCNSFVGFIVNGTFPKSPNPPKGYNDCHLITTGPRKGQWQCQLPGLVARRLGEQKICLGKIKPSLDAVAPLK
jgi:GH24 family phage-related lysozyme (muramidase)